MAKVMGDANAPEGNGQAQTPVKVREIVISINEKGETSVRLQGDVSIFEMLEITENLHMDAVRKHRFYMDNQFFGLIKLLKDKQVLKDGD
jgi:hypothetical protein